MCDLQLSPNTKSPEYDNYSNCELCFCVQPEKKDECVYEVCLPPEDSALEGGEEKSEGGEDGIKKRGVSAMVKIFHFIMKQSYICALIAMMVSNAARRWCNVRATEAGLCCRRTLLK